MYKIVKWAAQRQEWRRVEDMNVLKKCCYRSLKENRKRTLVTIVGIILATALLTAVACMVVSFRESMIAYEKTRNGDFHYLFSGVNSEDIKYFQNNKNLEKIGLLEEIGYALLEGSQNPDKPYLYIRTADEEGVHALSLKLVEGRMPENDRELAIGRHILTNGLVEYQVGDVVTLQIGNRIYDDKELGQESNFAYDEEKFVPVTQKTYTIVGMVERPNDKVEERMAPGYSAFTCPGESESGRPYEVYATYTDWGLRHMTQVTAGLLGVPEELYQRYYHGSPYTQEEGRQLQRIAKSVTENYWLLKWEVLIFSSTIMYTIYGMSAIAILVIVMTSIFCIRNSFTISLTEKMRLYGRLSSVGTTSGQQKKLVYYEAFLLGGIGIPLGVLCGVAASAVLVTAVVELVEVAVEIILVYAVSFPAILFGIVISVITVFLSAAKSARQAARISPINAIRGNEMVRLHHRGLYCPSWVNRFFGIGGKVAYKNLKRAKVKYRTTVVSIVVSVAAFIGLSTFTQLLEYASTFYYNNKSYQLAVNLRDTKDCLEQAQWIARLKGVEEADICQIRTIAVDAGQVPFAERYLEIYPADSGDIEEYIIQIRSLGEEGYLRYCRKLGLKVEEAKEKGIVLTDYELESVVNGKISRETVSMANYLPGDVITGKFRVSSDEGIKTDVEIEVLLQTEEKPMCLADMPSNRIMLIVSDEWMNQWRFDEEEQLIQVYLKCQDAGAIEQVIRSELDISHYTIINYESDYQSSRSLYLVVSIFLYGFITIVALIGVTNIFNTITTNMELRAPEFAMLKSIGMTGREFRRMIGLEGIFYGGKALLIGIPFGVFISYCFYRALGRGIVVAFQFPTGGIAISIAAVITLLYSIMRYSMAKINRKNVMETIRNENI